MENLRNILYIFEMKFWLNYFYIIMLNIFINIQKDNIMYKTGEKPRKGTYKCSKCNTEVKLDDNTDTLPPCPKCNNTTYDKIK